VTIRVLVVDDEPAIRELLVDFLTDEGYCVDAAADGVDAIERLNSFEPDVVIVDVMMPRLGGYEFVEWLRARGDRNLPAVIMMSAVDFPERSVTGVDAFVHKPFDIEELVGAIRSLVDHAPDSRAPEG
jgi:DNA-binding response OmpR family regulator